MSFGNLRQVTARYGGADVGKIYRKRLLAVLEILKNPYHDRSWGLNCAKAMSRAECDHDVWLDEYSSARVVDHMKRLDYALRVGSNGPLPTAWLADTICALSVILRQYDDYLNASPHKRAMIDARHGASTWLSACYTTNDVFGIVAAYVDQPYAIAVPTCGPAKFDACRDGLSRPVAMGGEVAYNVTMGPRGNVVSEIPWRCGRTEMERQLYDTITCRAMAFSKTHTAVCTALGTKQKGVGSLPYRWKISIRRTDQRYGRDEIAFDIEMSTRPFHELVCNGDGVLYAHYWDKWHPHIIKRVSLDSDGHPVTTRFYLDDDVPVRVESACGEYLACVVQGNACVYKIPADTPPTCEGGRYYLEAFKHGSTMDCEPPWPPEALISSWRTTLAITVDSAGRLLCCCQIRPWTGLNLQHPVGRHTLLAMWSYDTMTKVFLFSSSGWLPEYATWTFSAGSVSRMRPRLHLRQGDDSVYVSFVDQKTNNMNIQQLEQVKQ